MITIEQLSRELRRLHRTYTWEIIANSYGISKALAWRIAIMGYEPKRVVIRRVLGLPLMQPAPVCPDCNVVHLARKCPNHRPPAWVGRAVDNLSRLRLQKLENDNGTQT